MKAKNKTTGMIYEVENNIDPLSEYIYFIKPTTGYLTEKQFHDLYDIVEDKQQSTIIYHCSKCDKEHINDCPKETLEDRFNKEFGYLNIDKYDHERIINFIKNEIK